MQGSFHGGSTDLAQLQSTMVAIEQACIAVQMHINPAGAEATILSLRQSPNAYQTCQFILENSQVANARFQAAAAIRDVAIKEWGSLTSDDKRGLISFCLSFVMRHSSSVEGYVQVKVSSVAAQFLKRGWLEFTGTEKEVFLSEVKQAVIGSLGLDAQFVGINFLDSLVSEFSPSTSSSMGLPREFHEQCRVSLELDCLKQFYCWAQDAAQSVANKIVECKSAVAEDKVCSAALRLMVQILNWDFQFNTHAVQGLRKRINMFRPGVRQDVVLLKKSECILVQPGPTWHDVLLSSGHISWVLGLYGTLRQKFSSDTHWLDSPLALSARKLIVQFCSLTGFIFPSDNGQSKERHLVQVLAGILPWVDPPDIISKALELGKTESEMLDGCRALLSIATLTSPMAFDNLLKSISPFGTLSLSSALTCEVVKALLATDSEEETWSWVARDILLDTWTALLEPTDSNKDTTLPPEGRIAAATVFKLIVESELKTASTHAFDEEDVFDYLRASISAMDERLTSYALIARAAVDVTIPSLTNLFSERFALLHQVGRIYLYKKFDRICSTLASQGRGTLDPTCTLEELYSLLLLTGHVLADGGGGETNLMELSKSCKHLAMVNIVLELPYELVPESIQTHFVDTVEAEHHPVVLLSSSIIRFAEQSLDPEMRASFFSPRLMEAVIWFLARWSDTYLMPVESGKGNNCNPDRDHENQQAPQGRRVLFGFYGEYGQGKLVLDVIVRISLTALISYPGEKDLQALTCYQLLPALVRRKTVCMHLAALDSWGNVANAFANERSLFSLTAPHQRSLAETLVRSATGMGDSDASNQYVRVLMGKLTAYLVDISTKSDLKTTAQQPDLIFAVSCLLERLRGAARATQPRTQKAVYEMGVSVMSPVLTLIEIYKHESAVVYVLLKFVVDWVDGQVCYLENRETAVVVNFCMQLLQLYSSHNIGKISLSLSSSLGREATAEKYKDLRALLQLLTNLCSKDLVDFSSESSETDIAQVVYFGLHIVTPLISLELLKYPKLCFDYFSLLSHLLEMYPEKVAHLHADALAHILGTLDFGIHHQDIEVVDMCLGALKALASYDYKDKAAGREGLGSVSGNLQDSILSRFLQSLLQLLLFEDYSTELVGSAADALLPMILCEQTVYQRLGQELIERQATPALKSRLTNALQALTSSNQVSSSLDRTNYSRFRKNLNEFLTEVRGFLQIK